MTVKDAKGHILDILTNFFYLNNQPKFNMKNNSLNDRPTLVIDNASVLLSKRGIALIEKLSEKVVVHKPGNITSVIIK